MRSHFVAHIPVTLSVEFDIYGDDWSDVMLDAAAKVTYILNSGLSVTSDPPCFYEIHHNKVSIDFIDAED